MNIQSLNRPGILILAFAMLLMSATGALGVVWLRQQISMTAGQYQNLEREVAEFKRKNDYLDTKIAEAHNPDFLRANLQGQLGVPTKDQVVWADLRVEPFSPRLEDNKPFVIAFNLAPAGTQSNTSY